MIQRNYTVTFDLVLDMECAKNESDSLGDRLDFEIDLINLLSENLALNVENAVLEIKSNDIDVNYHLGIENVSDVTGEEDEHS